MVLPVFTQVIGKRHQAFRQVYVFNYNILRRIQIHMSKIPYGFYTIIHKKIRHLCSLVFRQGENCNLHTVLPQKSRKVPDHLNFYAPDRHTFEYRIYVKDPRQLKTSFVYVGDELRDVEACRKNNIPLVSVAWGLNSAASLEQANPNLVARDTNEAAALIKKAAGDFLKN